MTQDEIIRMAAEAGIAHAAGVYMEHLERFANLVAEATKEKAAKMCDTISECIYPDTTTRKVVEGCAAAIRSMK